jgi:hypothetical protein
MRIATRHNFQLISKYPKANAVRKLRLGCGYHRIAGWLDRD